MCIRYLGFVLLIWFPGVLHAQSATQSCSAPVLYDGFLAPEQETYSHGMDLTYTCNDGHKPSVKGWWAATTCQNGKWSHEPQCIRKEACFPPEIPNGKYAESPRSWYDEWDKIRVTCEEGYELKDQDATTSCLNGTWSSVPVCDRSPDACGVPPKIPHAVIVNLGYKELFANNSKVQYECEGGYKNVGPDDRRTITCVSGTWTEGPTCRSSTTSGLNGGDSGPTFIPIRNCGAYPNFPNGVAVAVGQVALKYQCFDSYTLVGEDTVVCYSDGRWSEIPACEGSSTTSGLNVGDSGLIRVPIRNCGAHPNVPNGVAVPVDQMSLKYRCNEFYALVGLDTVVCYSDGSWSKLPVCKEVICQFEPAEYDKDVEEYMRSMIRISGVQYVKEGEMKTFPCTFPSWRSMAKCTNGKLTLTKCYPNPCSRDQCNRMLVQ